MTPQQKDELCITKIKPLLDQVNDLCEKADISFVAGVGWCASDEHGETYDWYGPFDEDAPIVIAIAANCLNAKFDMAEKGIRIMRETLGHGQEYVPAPLD